MSDAHTPPTAVAAPAPRDSNRPLAVVLVGLSVVVLTCFLVTAIAHLRDGYQINFTAAVFMGLADETRDGHLYPDLNSGEVYGGTRYMPLPYILHAGCAYLCGGNDPSGEDLLFSGKILSLLLAVVLWGQAFLLLRKMDCSAPVALALATLLLTCYSVFFAATTIRGDILPVILQLGAMALVSNDKRTVRGVIAAGLLCTLAVLAKLTAGWAVLAILCHLGWNDRRMAGVFVAAWLGSLGASLGALHVVTHGAMAENFAALSAAGIHGVGDFLKSPLRLILLMSKNGSGTHCLAPLMAPGCYLAWRQRTWTMYHTALLLCLPMQMFIYSDMGTGSNHLIDLVVLAVMVVGATWAVGASEEKAGSLLQPILTMTLVWAMCSCWSSVLGHATRDSVSNLRAHTTDPRYPAKPVANEVGDQEKILSDDAWVPLSRGQKPVVLDAYSLARCVNVNPHHADALVARINSREFDKIVLVERVVGKNTDFGDDGEDRYMGKPLAKAIKKNYRLAAKSEGYLILVPIDLAETRLTLKGDESAEPFDDR